MILKVLSFGAIALLLLLRLARTPFGARLLGVPLKVLHIVYLAALGVAGMLAIPTDYYEAAELDGAGAWQKFRSITLPQLAPTTVLVLVLQMLASLKVFDQIYQMTGGGPGGSTRPVLLYIYEVGFTGYRLGYASAISYIFFFLIIIVSIAYMVISSRRSVKA